MRVASTSPSQPCAQPCAPVRVDTHLDDARRRRRREVAVERGVEAERCPRPVVVAAADAAEARRRAHGGELAGGAREAFGRRIEVLLRALAQAADCLQQQLAQLQARQQRA